MKNNLFLFPNILLYSQKKHYLKNDKKKKALNITFLANKDSHYHYK